MRLSHWFLLSPALLLPLFGWSGERPPPPVQVLDDETVSTLATEISGQRAKSYVTDICRYHRIEGAYEGTDYEKAVDYVMTFLAGAGVEDFQLHTYYSDGFKSYGTWLSRPGFRVEKAELYLVGPHRAKWCDYALTALSLMPYSNGHAVYEGEVVYVGKGTSDSDYSNEDVAGKIAFCEKGDAAAVMREAVLKRGALGILMGFSGNTRRGKFPDLVELNTLRLTGEETRASTWGFSLSVIQTDALKDFLKSGQRVVMQAVVDAETFAGHMPVISATIPGGRYPEQEVVLMAHLDHYRPGANDNASGSAGLMEIAATLTDLIEEGKIRRPLRTIRFLWVPEWNGTAAYIANNLNATRKGIAGVNLDMIGEDLKRCDTQLFITSAPLSQPSFLNAIMAYYARLVDELRVFDASGTRDDFKYEIIDYFCESDHMLFNDESIGVPTVMLSHFTDLFWHSSLDAPDKVDPSELKRCMLLGTLIGWTVASYDEDTVADLVELTCWHLENRVDRYARGYIQRFSEEAGPPDGKLRRTDAYLDLLHDYWVKSIEAIVDNLDSYSDKGTLENARARAAHQIAQHREDIAAGLHGDKAAQVTLSAMESECRRVVPEKVIDVAFSGWKIIELRWKLGLNKYMNNDMVHEMLNFTDGRRSLLEIRDAVSAEYREVEVEHVRELFDAFEERRIVRYEP